MANKIVNVAGTATRPTTHSSDFISQKLDSKFRSLGWNVRSIVVTYPPNSSVANLSFSFLTKYSASEMAQYARNVLSSFTENDLFGNGQYDRFFISWDIQGYETSNPATTNSGNNPATNTGTPPGSPDFIDQLAAQLKMSRQTVMILLAVGGVLLIAKIAAD